MLFFRVTSTLTNNRIVSCIATCETFSIQLLMDDRSVRNKSRAGMTRWHGISSQPAIHINKFWGFFNIIKITECFWWNETLVNIDSCVSQQCLFRTEHSQLFFQFFSDPYISLSRFLFATLTRGFGEFWGACSCQCIELYIVYLAIVPLK